MSDGQQQAGSIGFSPEEMRTDQPTRSARLKWVVVVDQELPPGQAVNAAVCISASTAAAVSGLLGGAATDSEGSVHPGLPWSGCSVLSASSAELGSLRAKATAAPGVFVADMPAAAQQTRVYDDYLARVSETSSAELSYTALSIVGPRNRIDKIVGRLSLLP